MHRKGHMDQCVRLMLYFTTFAVIAADFHKILVMSFRKPIFTNLYTCSFQTVVCFQMICKSFWIVGAEEVVELRSFMAKDIRI